MELAGDAAKSAKPAARKRNRKSRARSQSASSSGATSGSSAQAGEPGAAGAEEGGSLLIDVVCGVNRARLRVDALRNGSKTPCVYMQNEPAAAAAAAAAGDLSQGDDKRQPLLPGELQPPLTYLLSK